MILVEVEEINAEEGQTAAASRVAGVSPDDGKVQV